MMSILHLDCPDKPLVMKFDKYWRSGWIPIAEFNNEDYFFIDLDPGPGGKVGQIGILEDAEIHIISESFEEWLDEIESKLVLPNCEENEWPWPDQVYYSR